MKSIRHWFSCFNKKHLPISYKPYFNKALRPELQVLEDRLTPVAPSFTSPATISVPENTTAVRTVIATDADGDTLTYSIDNTASSANIDQGRFAITTGGVLTFSSAPNFESPTDSNANNVYLVTVKVEGGTNTVTQNLKVTVTNVNEAPTITSAASVSVAENNSVAMAVRATDPDARTTLRHSISNSYSGDNVDGAAFAISSSGVLTFVTAPNYESPTDNGANRLYNVTVRVTDGSIIVSQNIVVTVTDSTEATVTWVLDPRETTTGSGARSCDNQLTYIATFSEAPTRALTAKDFLLSKAKVVSITEDGSDPTIYEVVIQPATGSAPVSVVSSVKAGWNGINSLASATRTISVFRATSLTPRTSPGANPAGYVSSTTVLNDLVFTFPQDIDTGTVDTSSPYSDFAVVGCTITSVTIAGRTILVDATITSLATPSNSGEVSVKLRDGRILDTYGNPFRESARLHWVHDNKAPTAVLEITSGSGVVGQNVDVSVTFSEMITDFKPAMVRVTLDGVAVTVRVTGSRTGWGFRFRVSAAGTLSIGLDTSSTVAGQRVADRNGNRLASANTLSMTGFVA